MRQCAWDKASIAPQVVIVVLAGSVLVSACMGSHAGESGAGGTRVAPEYVIKAGYLYNFFLFVKWPDTGDAPGGGTPLVLGILGTDRFGDAFAKVDGAPVPGLNRPMKIRKMGPYRRSLDLSACHILFIDASERRHLAAIFSAIHAASVLTVSDMKGFVDAQGMIGFVNHGEFVRWEINRTPMRAAGIAVSAQLLRSAVYVADGPDEK
jgi:hypothetical protein